MGVRSVGAEGIASHHLDLDDRIIALAGPVSGEPPFIVTERGAVLRALTIKRGGGLGTAFPLFRGRW